MGSKLRQVVDLYTTGKVVPLKDGTPVWVQPLNPFEQDTARNEAMIAKSRITLAIKEHGSDEQNKVRMWFFEDGLDDARETLVSAKLAENTGKIYESIRNDPDWAERMQILDRGGEDTAVPLEEAETKLLTQITNEFSVELGKRLSDERDYLSLKIEDLDEEALWDEYLNWFISRRANDVASAEFRLYQLYYGTRWCNGTDHGENTWTHESCDSHQERLFDTKDDVRTAPEELLELLAVAMAELDMSVREAKNSHRQGSSSGSSLLPSEGEASTASTPTATPAEPHGSSSSPSATPSLSSVGQS